MFAFRKCVALFPCVLALAFFTCIARSIAEPVERTANGMRIHSAVGTTTVEVCSEGVIHVVAGKTGGPPNPLVPAVIRPCAGTAFTVSSDSSAFHITTEKLRVDLAADSGSVRFSRKDGKTILAEVPNPRLKGTDDPGAPKAIEQTFLLSPDEALYGLGQHQEGFLNVRDVPVRLLQANTDIAIPFLISTSGYGLLWNNPSLTDFNPADQEITLDESGKGAFQSGPEGEYGFLLSGNGRDKLCLTDNGETVIDLKSMWLPWSAGGRIHLAANTTYKVTAESGGNARLFARSPSDTMAFRSDAGSAVDYYFMYGPAPDRILASYRMFTGDAPLLP